MSFFIAKGVTFDADSIEAFQTEYYNGGQTIVTYVVTKSGAKFTLNDITSSQFKDLIDEAKINNEA